MLDYIPPSSQDYIDQINETGDAFFPLDQSRSQVTMIRTRVGLTMQEGIHYQDPEDARVQWYTFASLPRD